MKKFYAILLIIFSVVVISSCTKKIEGEGPVVTATRTTDNFNEIEFSVPGTIKYIQGTERSIKIEAQQNIIDIIETRVSSNKLRVYIKDNKNIRSHEAITITVTEPAVYSIALKGSGNLEIPGVYTPTNAELSVSGSGNIYVDEIETNNLEINISGSGNAEIGDGIVEDEKITISGSGNVDLSAVESKTATTKTSGSGTIKLFATDELNVTISGSGDVYYKGIPVVNADVSGSGKVRKL